MGLSSIISDGFDVAKSAFSGDWAAAVGGALSFLGGERRNSAQTELANTSYQRAMADMKKAGLNPILAYKQGGADTPILQDTLTPAITTGLQAYQAPANVNKTLADTAVSEEQITQIKANVDNLSATTSLTYSQQRNVIETLEKIQAEINYVVSNTQGVNYENVQREAIAKFTQESGDLSAIARSLGFSIGNLPSLLQRLLPKGK